MSQGSDAARPCPLCGAASDVAFVVRDRNRAITELRFAYRRCASCQTIFIDEVPADLGRYYPEDYYGLPPVEQLDRFAAAEAPKLRFVQKWVAPGRLVEIGAGFGLFARAARNAGFDVTAIEMDARCCAYLEDVVGVHAIQSDEPERILPTLGMSRAVALWHVLEHLPRPWDVLERAAAVLEAGGVLAVAMPNPESLQMRVLGTRWAHIDAPRHLFLIPLSTLTAKASSLGLELVEATTSDPAGRHWNWFGWEYAIRRQPAQHRSTLLTRIAARGIAASLAALEHRGLSGAAYTAVFVRR